MTAALDIADHGYPVTLVEKEAELGGNLRRIPSTLEGEPVQPALQSQIEKTKAHPGIQLFTGAAVKEVSGFVGNFKTTIEKSDSSDRSDVIVEHGVVVVATGAAEYKPDEYLYGKDDRVVTQRELGESLASAAASPSPSLRKLKCVVMIQCVGSRTDENPNCSRVCCSAAIKNALKLKVLNPRMEVFVLYRDVRSYGLKELYYTKAREAGVIFVRYEKDGKPQVAVDSEGLAVVIQDQDVKQKLRLRPDLLVLSAGIVPNPDNKFLSQLLKVPLGQDGFFLEAHVKLRPVDFATDGVFVCGLAHYPKDIGEATAQAKAAASRAVTVLSRDEIEAEGKVSVVMDNRCNGCRACIEVCPYKAIDLDPAKAVAVVNEALCKGCGTCAASCRSAAIALRGFRDEEILAALDVV
jgi:heterodisulfide reductase subunit A